MFLRIWQWLRGYVRVTVTGFSVERYLNMAAFRGIYMWNARRDAQGIEMNVTIPGFKQLRHCSRKTKCRTRMVKKVGLPFWLYRYRRRKLLMGGVVFFAVALYVLSLFVWRIDIVGSETLHHDTVLVFLAQEGLNVGRPKWRINNTQVQRALMAQFDEIGWADIHTRGTRATVLIAEAVLPQPLIDRQTPTHVVAQREGLITNVVAGAGAPLVRAGDVVQAGDVLVSGLLQLQSEEHGPIVVYVHAYAEVWARRYYPIQFSVPLAYTVRVPTGRTRTRHGFQLLVGGLSEVRLPGGSIPFVAYDRITTQHQPGISGDYPLPLVWLTTRFYEFAEEPRTRTIPQAQEHAALLLTGRILREFDFDVDIIEKRMTFTETDEALLVDALVITNERIDRLVPQDVPTPEEGESTWTHPNAALTSPAT